VAASELVLSDAAILPTVIGLYLAEGHVSADGQRQRIFWSLHPTREQELVDDIAGYWQALGVKRAVVQSATAMHVSVSSRLLAAVFTSTRWCS